MAIVQRRHNSAFKALIVNGLPMGGGFVFFFFFCCQLKSCQKDFFPWGGGLLRAHSYFDYNEKAFVFDSLVSRKFLSFH